MNITIVTPTGETKAVQCFEDQTLLQVAREHDIYLEGACDGCCACSTCHVILDDKTFDQLEREGQAATDKENDLVDQAFFPEPTSRLGCQIKVKRSHDKQLVAKLPKATRNMAVDGYKATPH